MQVFSPPVLDTSGRGHQVTFLQPITGERDVLASTLLLQSSSPSARIKGLGAGLPLVDPLSRLHSSSCQGTAPYSSTSCNIGQVCLFPILRFQLLRDASSGDQSPRCAPLGLDVLSMSSLFLCALCPLIRSEKRWFPFHHRAANFLLLQTSCQWFQQHIRQPVSRTAPPVGYSACSPADSAPSVT